jgi:ubiquitin-like 1-activating enzyme E1 A
MDTPIHQEPAAEMISAQAESNGSAPAANGISADEIALYDRQIRLWGMKAQEKIRNANILLITIKALGNEIAKNLVLAGIGSITVVDHEVVTEADLGAQFFLSAADGHIGMNRAVAASAAIQRLNPRVRVIVDQVDIRLKPPSFYGDFNIVIATDLDSNMLDIINTATRLSGRAFYAASSLGMYGFLFADLIEHDYVIQRARSNMTTATGKETKTRSIIAVSTKADDDKIELVTKRELYSTWLLASDVATLPDDVLRSARRRRVVTPVLSCLRALWAFTGLYNAPPNANDREQLKEFTRLAQEKHKALGLPAETLRSEVLRSFLQNIGSEISPVAAVLGGQLAQDVINVLGQTQQPIQNFVIFDGGAMEATMYPLHPDGPLGRALLSSQMDVSMGTANGDEALMGAVATGMFGPVTVPTIVDPSQVISLD